MTQKRTTAVIITCEHAGNRVPAGCRALMSKAGPLLSTHRGYDIGALALARDLASAIAAPLIFTTVTRLVVDANRSRHSRTLFSEFTAPLDAAEKEKLLRTWYDPYRRKADLCVQDAIDHGNRVLHLSIHTFTPVLDHVTRNVDIGFLYDPGRVSERQTADLLINAFTMQLSGLKYRRNYPYRGTADSLTTHLRKIHADNRYRGIEIEVNQKFAAGRASGWRTVRRRIAETLSSAVMNGA